MSADGGDRAGYVFLIVWMFCISEFEILDGSQAAKVFSAANGQLLSGPLSLIGLFKKDPGSRGKGFFDPRCTSPSHWRTRLSRTCRLSVSYTKHTHDRTGQIKDKSRKN